MNDGVANGHDGDERERRDTAYPAPAFFRPAPYPEAPEPDATAPIPTVGEVAADRPRRRRSLAAALRAIAGNWPALIPLALFAVAAVVVPTMTTVATSDDWAYARTTEILYWDVRLTIFPAFDGTAVGQALWGGLFALIFGMTLGVLRLSTVVLVGLGAVALYAILRQAGVSRGRSAIGMALSLFNPLALVLSFTFLPDPQFTALLLIALALFLRGLRQDDEIGWLIVLGSLVAGFAFLVRPQGALIPLAVLLWLLLGGRLPLGGTGLRRGLQIAAIPAVTIIGYALWMGLFNDVPDTQPSLVREALDHGWAGTWLLIRRLGFYVPMYLGVLLLPIAIALVPGVRERGRPAFFASPVGYWLFLGWSAFLLTMFFALTRAGHLMPYLPEFVGPFGLGPLDVRGDRPLLVEDQRILEALTIAAILGALVLGLLVLRRVGRAARDDALGQGTAGLVAMATVLQFAGIVPSSYRYLDDGISLDRFLLPLIPLTIVLLLWAIRDLALLQPLTWVGVALFAVVATAGTRDYLVFMDAVWDLGRFANAYGVPDTKLDAGAAWEGYHLYTRMLDEGTGETRTPAPVPWWIDAYAKPTDSSYIVTTDPDQAGYRVVEERAVDQWLDDDPARVYLMRRDRAPWPP